MPLAQSAKVQVALVCAALVIGGGTLVLASYSPLEFFLSGERRGVAPEVKAQFELPGPATTPAPKAKSGCGAPGGKCCCAAVGKACGCGGDAPAKASPEAAGNVAVMTAVTVGLSAPGGQGVLTGPAAIAATPKLRPVVE